MLIKPLPNNRVSGYGALHLRPISSLSSELQICSTVGRLKKES
jgi:hypothetical protein